MTNKTQWICPTCKAAVTSPFCPRCGEERLSPRDLTLRGLVANVLDAVTSIDARALRSVRKLVLHPGALTLEWMNGSRKRYVAPFQLFLIANVIFFVIQWATGENVFSSSLDSHMHHQDWSELARSCVAHHLEAIHVALAQYAPMFDQAVVVNAKSLVLLMTLPFALLLPLGFLRERRPFLAHVVFSLHLYTFLLMGFCLALLAARLSRGLGFGGLDAPMVDNVLSLLNLGVCTLYIYAAIGPVYGAQGALRIVKAILLALAAAVIVIGYRFGLFFITLYTT